MTARRRAPKSPAAKELENGHAFAVVVEQLRSQLGVVAETVLDRPTRGEVETQFAEVREALRDRPTRRELDERLHQLEGRIDEGLKLVIDAIRLTKEGLEDRFDQIDARFDRIDAGSNGSGGASSGSRRPS